MKPIILELGACMFYDFSFKSLSRPHVSDDITHLSHLTLHATA